MCVFCVKEINSIFDLSFYYYLVSYNTIFVVQANTHSKFFFVVFVFLYLLLSCCTYSLFQKVAYLLATIRAFIANQPDDVNSHMVNLSDELQHTSCVARN